MMLASTLAASAQTNPPSYLEFSTFFQLGPNSSQSVTSTDSKDYPVTSDAPSNTIIGRGVGLTRLSADLDRVEFSGTWGGSDNDQLFRARSVAGDRVIWCGSTGASDLPNLAEPLPEPLSTFSTN